MTLWRPTVEFIRSLCCYAGKRILMYQAYFILNIGRPRAARPSAVLQHYNRSMGRASPAMVSKLQAACTEIYAVQTWQGYFERLRLPCPQRCEVLARLRNAVLNSRQKGYHGLRPGETPASLNSQPARTPVSVLPIMSCGTIYTRSPSALRLRQML